MCNSSIILAADKPEHKDGHQLTESVCTSCHGLNLIQYSSGYTAEDWQALSNTMINLSESPELQQKITDYLADNYPPTNRRSPKLIDGDKEIEFIEWIAPTLGQRVRDPVEAPDGSIWWAGQWGDIAGRIDVTTNEMTEFKLPINSKPHTVTTDTAGNIWFTGNGNGTMGKLQLSTGEITVYEMPDPNAKDPHSAIFDQQGILWFTLQHSNMVGRLDPETGDIKLVDMLTPRSRPYGIKIDANGNPWIACNGSNCLVKVDPETMTLSEYKLPNEKTTVRRLDIDSQGIIWYVNSSQGKLGMLNPKSGEIKEWPSPSGAKSHPYAIAVIDDIVWYNESGKRPDTLVRFDPANETFQSWEIPSGDVYSGIVRHMRPSKDGDLIIHQSATNRVILVKLNLDR
ncbi:MAG: cytochrome C [Pseudomonadota bacterium]